MLESLARIVTSKPWMVVVIIILITIGFSLGLPSLEMQTSMEDFLPDDEVVLAEERIQSYFGASNDVIMVLTTGDSRHTLLSPQGLRTMYQVSEDITDLEGVDEVMSIAGFVDLVCSLEYNKSLDECSNQQIQSAYNDLISDPLFNTQLMHELDDENEDVDFQRFTRFSKKSSIDTMDVKNLKIGTNESHLIFTIDLYDAADITSLLLTRTLRVNIIEWYICFQNLIGPEELQDMQYRLSARLEPTEELWEYGDGIIPNVNHLIQLIRSGNLRNSYTFTPYLWITPPGETMAFPLPLQTANITWDQDNPGIIISVSRKELGEIGIGFESENFGMPARLGNLSTGVRVFQSGMLNKAWQRRTVNLNATMDLLTFIQHRPLIGGLAQRLIIRQTGMGWEDINEMMSMMKDQMTHMESLSLPQMDQYYVTTDRAPDQGSMSGTVFLKPVFLQALKDSIINFLSSDFDNSSKTDAVLLMVTLNATLDLSQLETVSLEVLDLLDDVNQDQDAISFQGTGNSIMEYEINEVSMEANQLVIPLIFVVISVILFLSFRRLSYVILPLVGLTFAIIWMFGTMVFLGMSFMVMEVALIPMLMGLGVDYSVHLYHNYRVEKGKGKNAKQAMERSIEDIGVAMLLATITTFIAFLSFLTATMIPLRDFGVLCAVGIAYVFAITLTFQAAMRFIIDRRSETKQTEHLRRETKKEYGKGMRRIARVVCTHPVPILVTTLLITGAMVYGASQIQTGFSMEDFLPETNPSVVVLNDILDEFPFASQEKEYVLIETDNVATISVLYDIDETISRFEDDQFVLRDRNGQIKTESVLLVMQNAMEKNGSLVDRFDLDDRGIPSSDQQVELFFDYLYDHDAYSYGMKTYLNQDEDGGYNATVLHVYTNAFSDNGEDVGNVMAILYEELTEDVNGLFADAKVTVTGDNSMMHVIMNSMTESQLISTGVCLLLAAIVLIIAYRNPVLGLITMIPVSISTIWIVGAMYYIGYQLNVMTIMITSLTIGLGITYAIHAVERFRLSANNTGDVIEAVSETIGHTGGALLISAVTTMLGFGLLVFTPMPVEQQFGLITALTIMFAFLTSIFILPPVLLFWGRWRKNHKGYIISEGDPNQKKR